MKQVLPHSDAHQYVNDRRAFISNAIKASLAAAFVFPAGPITARPFLTSNKSYTVGDIMDMILKEIPGAPFSKTVDTLKTGNRDMVVTGILTTMFATVDIIHQAIKSNANFIIAHEPTFYNHTDDLKWTGSNHIVDQKLELLEKNKITVWRLHDYLHSFVPDSVTYGVVKDAGWLSYYKTGQRLITIPSTSLGNLAKHLKDKLDIAQVRVIGDLSHNCERVALMPGASGGQSHISMVEKEQPDVLVVGEVHEWETAEYIRDTLRLGGKTALIVLGHSVSEEPGLKWLQQWLQPRLGGLKVEHIASGNPFTFV
jgi:putative NIF3 family GTP cyclohydrolase 1 type 2